MISYCNRHAHDVFNMMYEQKLLQEMRARGEDTQEAYEELKIIDTKRHNLHNAMIDSVNLLSRELTKKDKDISWMNDIVANSRAGYANFALLTFYSLHGRLDIPSTAGANGEKL